MGGKNASVGVGGVGSLNSSASNSVMTNATSSSLTQQQQQLQAKYIKSKRSQTRYTHLQHAGSLHDSSSYLHLNSLWSIWYGVLLTLFQGYLAMHGAYRFLGCSLIPWKIEPVAELNLQIVLSGVVFILLPVFFTSAVFKVGNLANDGIKLATGAKERRCSLAPHDGLEEESRGGTLRALWTHGGPTAAFVHILIALCLLLPRLLLEARIIENGLLPKEQIWATELDFVVVNRRNLMALSVVGSKTPYQSLNVSSLEHDDEDYYNDTMFTAVGDAGAESRNNLYELTRDKEFRNFNRGIGNENGGRKAAKATAITKTKNGAAAGAIGETRYFEVPDLINRDIEAEIHEIEEGEQRVLEQVEAERELNANNDDDADADGADTGTIIMPDFDVSNVVNFTKPKPTTLSKKATTSTTTTTIDSNNNDNSNQGKLNMANWQKLGTLGKANSLNGIETMESSKIVVATTRITVAATTVATTKPTPTTTSTAAPTKTTTRRTTRKSTLASTTTTTADSLTAATPSVLHHHHHHHNQQHHTLHQGNHSQHKSGRNKHHKQQRQRQQHQQQREPLRRHHVNSPEQVLESYEQLSPQRSEEQPWSPGIADETTTRDSSIHRVRPEVLPEIIIPSTPVSSNSKIIAIKAKTQKRRIVKRMTVAGVEIEPEYLVGDLTRNNNDGDGSTITSSEFKARSNEEREDEDNLSEEQLDDADFQTLLAVTPPATAPSSTYVRLDGFAGMLQLFFGIDKPIDAAVFAHPPSAEFVNLLCALLVWTVRYPAVFWNTTKSFASVFSLQMVVAALDIVFGYIGVSNLYKLQIYAEAMPVHQPGLILNASVTLALYLLATVLVIASSMVMYLYGHGRIATRMRDRSIITLKSSETWIYFAHCASLCFVLALAVVKAPLLNDLSVTYKNNLHCPTFVAALIGVVHLLLWIFIWLCLTIKRRWHFKLPPLDMYGGLINKTNAQPLMMASGQRTGSIPSSGGNSTSTTVNGASSESKPDVMNTATSTELSMGMGVTAQEDIYWPKLTPSSPKLKVTFNEVTSTSDDVLLIGDQEQTDGKRHTSRGAAVCFTSSAGEIDDGEYATLRAATAATVVGITLGSVKGSVGSGLAKIRSSGSKMLHLSEYDDLPPPSAQSHQQTIHISDYANLSSLGGISDDNISEEGKLLACVRDDSITYASTRDLEPPQPQPPPPPPPLPVKGATQPPPLTVKPHPSYARAPQAMPEIMQLSSTSPDHQQQYQPQHPSHQHLVSPLAPVTVTVHTNEAHIASSSTPRCLRRADSGVPNEALTPRSDTTSTTESTTSPPERAPSESSSGVHSGEEREVEVIIRPRVSCKPLPKPPQPPIQEEPYGRCTNMRMSSFNADSSTLAAIGAAAAQSRNNSATLPLQRSAPEQKFDYTSHCSTMPLPAGCHSQQHVVGAGAAAVGYASTSAMQQSMTASLGGAAPPLPLSVASMSSFKTPTIHYANSSVALSGLQSQNAPHTTLSNGVRYSNPHFLRRLPHVSKAAESPYGHLGYGAGHHTFSKLSHETQTLAHTAIPEDRDSANYSMASDQDCGLYVTAQLH